ncbi:por secretion system C-terminal sorting domain [Bacteroidales bacterium 6E]|nr:por secretion system C-terminal sorting domain [Bacteroidales bacterium 6E]
MGKFTQSKTIVLNQIRNSVLVVLLTVLSFVTVKAQTTVADVVINSESHTTLEAAVIAAGLAEALSGEGSFTVFAPTDAAFAALPAGTVEALLADPDGALKDILLYHVLGSKVMSTDLSDGLSATTLLGKDITVTINDNGVFINGARVTVADIETDNGVVHVIDAVMVPARTTVVDVVINSESHTTLEAAVIAAGLAEALSGEGPFTVFAPTDAAFAALPAGTVEALLADPDGALKDILLYHVLGSKVMSTDLSDGLSATTLLGKDITVTINDNGVFINGAKVTVADIETDNGVVHVIDAVLVPAPTTVVDVVVNSESHTTLEAAVIAAGLAEALSGEGPFTVFAPTDAAFATLPAGTVEALLADPDGALKDILLYHVLGSKVMSTDLSNGMTATTLLGEDITVTTNDNGVFINGAKVTVADIETDNGVVHVIDAVITPDSPMSIMDVVNGSEVHKTLASMVRFAGLTEALSSPGSLTLFAPTDAAFAALPSGLLAYLVSAPEGFLADILLHHVVAGRVMSTDLSDGMKATSLLGEDIHVTINADGVFINGAKVIVSNIVTQNGVVHVVDAVIVPPSSIQVAENATFGKYLTDSRGNTLYFFARDAKDVSNCTGGCLDNWPVFYDENLRVGEGLTSTDFGVIDRGNGVMQTTYKGWPLYYFVNDTQAGQINGDGRINAWFVAKPDYTIMLVNNQLTGNNGINYKGDYTPGDEVVQYFTDAYGRTLYTWSRDFNNTNKFTRPDFSNNGNWPVYEETIAVVPSILDASEFSVINIHGRNQLTYRGWPLYYFGADGMVRGSNKGVSVPSPGVWPVARQTMNAAMPATVADVVINSDQHNTLEAAVIAAGLAEALSGEGPFTVFAPTDAAFAALPAGTVEALLADPDGALKDILLYHVLGSKVMSTDLSNGMTATTLLGKDIRVTINAEGVFINGAKVTVADIETDNGVVHVIDAVMVPARTTVVDVVVNSESHTTLEAAVIAAGLAEALSGEGPFTVFAPTDAAFAALPAGTVEALLADPDGALKDILLDHVLGSKVMSTDLSDGLSATTLLGKDIMVTINDNGVFINGAKVTVADIETDNGVVHVIDAVLVPAAERTTVVDVVVNSESHTTLEAAVIAAGLAEALSGEGPFTVFAPTDAAFAALPAGTVEALLADPDGALKDILLYHVLGSKVMSTDLSDGLSATTLLGKDIMVTINDNGVFINGAKVTVADIETDNGVVHVIDAVLVPAAERTTVVDVVVNSESHTTLEAAVIAAGLAEALSGEGPFTVFAPTDAAFAALPAGTVEALLADPDGALKDILLYHVLGSKVMSTDLSDGLSATTLLGKDIMVTINAEGVFINNARVTVADIETDNGVVHVIDAVLSPATNVGDDLRNNDMFTMYPNPAVSNVAVDFGSMDLNRNAMLRIIRMDGALMKSMQVQSSRVDIALDSFVQGMYLVVLENGNKRYTEKLIVK